MKIIPTRMLRRHLMPLALGLSLLWAGISVRAANKQAWEPIAPADLAATECKAYPGSSAEVLLERKVMTTSVSEQICHHYRQMKIYSPKGADEAGIMKIQYAPELHVWEVAARLTKPNGTVKEFTRKDLTEEVVAKKGSAKIKVMTLIIDDLGAGDVLDMRWSEEVESDFATYHWEYFQGVVPIRHFLFTVNESMQDCLLQSYNLPAPRVQAVDPKKAQVEVFDVPPFLEEPHMPPARDVRGWFILLYTPPHLRYRSEGDLWKGFSKYRESEYRSETKTNGEIKAKAAELVKDATTDEEKLRRLYEFCRSEISNLNYFDSEKNQKVVKKIDGSDWEQTAAQTLVRKAGYTFHINALFASLAKAAGYDARLALSASRNITMQIKNLSGWAFMRDQLVAVRVQNVWKFYSPGDYFVPPGMLHRSNEGAMSLVCDPKEAIFEINPVSVAEKSPVKRKGRFVLDAEGTLEGDVEISYDGHAGITRKIESLGEQQAVVDADYRASITRRLPSAEVEALVWENLSGTQLPVIVRYHLKVPAYADLAGSKIILPTNVFEHGAPAVFSSEVRKYSVWFPHAVYEQDDIEIRLPDGFVLESGTAPEAVGDTKKILGVTYDIGYSAKNRKVIYSRNFAIGGNGSIAAKAVSYPVLKALLDEIQRGDEHTLVLQPAAVAVRAKDTTETRSVAQSLP